MNATLTLTSGETLTLEASCFGPVPHYRTRRGNYMAVSTTPAIDHKAYARWARRLSSRSAACSAAAFRLLAALASDEAYGRAMGSLSRRNVYSAVCNLRFVSTGGGK